jgi:hypothetical protein
MQTALYSFSFLTMAHLAAPQRVAALHRPRGLFVPNPFRVVDPTDQIEYGILF